MIKEAQRWSLFIDYSRIVVNSLDEIAVSKDIFDDHQRMEYLIGKAREFIRKNELHLSAVIAWYILSEVDHESIPAREILKDSYTAIFVKN